MMELQRLRMVRTYLLRVARRSRQRRASGARRRWVWQVQGHIRGLLNQVHLRDLQVNQGWGRGMGLKSKRGGKEDSFTIYHFSRRATFYLPCNDASNQTIKTIGIDMQLQDLAFESPIWQDPLYVLKARSLHPLDTPKTLTVHHDINRRM